MMNKKKTTTHKRETTTHSLNQSVSRNALRTIWTILLKSVFTVIRLASLSWLQTKQIVSTVCQTSFQDVLLGITLPHNPDSGKFRGSSTQSHCSPQFSRETQRFTQTKNPTPQKHRDIGRICSSSLSGFPQ